jgi:signal transduction histidine kinase
MLMCDTVGADYGGIVTFDRHNNSLEIEVLHGYTDADARAYRGALKTLPTQEDTSVSRKALAEALSQSPPRQVLIIKEGSDPIQLKIALVDQTLSYAVSSADGIIGVITLERKAGSSLPRFEDTSQMRSLIDTCARVTAVALAARQSFVFSFDEFLRQKEFTEIGTLGREVTRWIYDKFKANLCSLYFIKYDPNTGTEYLSCMERIVDGAPQVNARQIRYDIEEGYAARVPSTPQRFTFTSFDGDESPEVSDLQLPASVHLIIDQIRSKYPRTAFESYLGVPAVYRGQLQGWIEVLDVGRKYGFTDAGLLMLIARRVSSEYSRIMREEQRENLFAIPNIETGDLMLVIREVVENAMKATAATHGLFMNKGEKDNLFHPEAVRGYGLTNARLSPVARTQKNLAAWVINNWEKGAFLCSDLNDRSTIEPGPLSCLDESFLPNGFLPPKTRSLLMVPAYLKDPVTKRIEDLGVLILMSYKPNAFKRDEILITILAEIVSYHIWASKKSEELESERQQVSQLKQAMPYYSKASMAATAAAGTVHTARQHIKDVKKNIKALLKSKDVRDRRELLELAEGIQKQFDDLTVIYNRLHDIFRGGTDDVVQAGSVLFEDCNLAELVQEVRSYMEKTFRDRSIYFDAAGLRNANLPKVKADSVLMKVVFINLINNSMDAGARRITVAAKKTTHFDDIINQTRPAVEVTFKDDGIGIPQEKWENVFELFFTENKKSGSGLGLAVNRDILHQHQGEIKITSSRPSGGTTFSLVWPTDLK